MPSQCYPAAREKFATAQLDWLAGTLRCVLLPESYVPNFADEFLSDIFVGSRIAISDPLEGRTATNGFCNSSAIKFPVLLDNRNAARAIIYRDTGVESTSSLIFLMDSPELLNVPLPLQGLDYFIYPSALDGGFFRL